MTEKLRKPIFSRNEQVDKIAFLGWRMDFGAISNMITLLSRKSG